MATIDKQKEAYKLIDHINKNVCMGFSASIRPDGSVLLEYNGYESQFEIAVEFNYQWLVWIVDNCPHSTRGAQPNLYNHRGQIGFITLALAKYNVALEKRLNK